MDGKRCRKVWLPLDDVDEGSGGLMVLPGRHAAGRAPFRRLRTASDVATFRFYHKYSLYEVDVSQAQRRPWAVRKSRRRRRAAPTAAAGGRADPAAPAPVAYEMPAGGLSLHHPLLPHCSGPNRSSRPRRVIIMRFQSRTEPLEAEGLVREPCTGVSYEKRSYQL